MTRKMWKFQIYAERAWNLAILLATEAGKREASGKGYAVISEETRYLSLKLFNAIEKAEYGSQPEDMFDKEIADIAKQTSLLALNGCVEMIRQNNYRDAVSRDSMTVAICLEDIRNLAIDLHKLLDSDYRRREALLQASNPITTDESRLFFLQFKVGGLRIVESIWYVKEIIGVLKPVDGNIRLRGLNVPVINLFDKLGLSGSPDNCIIINTDWKEREHLYAIPTDAVDTDIEVFRSRIGKSVEPRNGSIPAEYIRECWDTGEDEQMIFLDWCKLAE